MHIHPERTWNGIQINEVNWSVYTDKMWYHCQCGFYIDFWVNTSLIHRYQHLEEYNVPIFCKQEDGGCWVSLKMKQKLPILNLNSIITKRTRYRDIPSHTWILLGDNYTLPRQTSGTPTFHNLSVETENIFKAKLWYYISKSPMTKHCCLHIQSSDAW